ncbi:SLOG domain-containing protein [Limimaricola cinnabarinus]|uniref:SLOG domain-containing protein n=1 Tax=Limimaricola cinnabarinus TaxID=1125964 RepID=UPI002FDFD773
MRDAIFLSASVPDPKRGPEFAATADSVLIGAAVSALVHVTLGRRPLVWGGHPAITPMIWVVAQDIGVDYGRWVQLYQSAHFEDEFPEDNEHFQNVTYTEDVEHDRDRSLLLMRERMFSEHVFKAAVFVGGMSGIIQEYELFRHYQPDATVLPIVSTGGATRQVAESMGALPAELTQELDYVALFHEMLGVSVREERFKRPEDQPSDIEDRFWQPPTPL